MRVTKLLESDQFQRLVLDDMKLDDLDEVFRIELSAYPFPWKRSMFESSLSSSDDCLVLRLDGGIVGYAILSYVLDEAHLLNICIDPEYGSMGLGRVLLRQIIALVIEKKSAMFFLEVRYSNSRAINLYFSEGFNEVGIRPNYYPLEKGREDAVLMTLDLSVDLEV